MIFKTFLYVTHPKLFFAYHDLQLIHNYLIALERISSMPGLLKDLKYMSWLSLRARVNMSVGPRVSLEKPSSLDLDALVNMSDEDLRALVNMSGVLEALVNMSEDLNARVNMSELLEALVNMSGVLEALVNMSGVLEALVNMSDDDLLSSDMSSSLLKALVNMSDLATLSFSLTALLNRLVGDLTALRYMSDTDLEFLGNMSGEDADIVALVKMSPGPALRDLRYMSADLLDALVNMSEPPRIVLMYISLGLFATPLL